VVNDGSEDDTNDICNQYSIKLVNHPYNLGNGAAIKSGAREATREILAFMDADGQHSVEDLNTLLKEYTNGFDMVVGAREMRSHAGKRRLFGNLIYNFIASKVVGKKVHDLTSGLRVCNSKKFKEFLYLLPNGFSYPTTITMAFFKSGYSVNYVPISTDKRIGKSHLRLYKDGLRFLIIIVKIAALYSPLKVFSPISFVLFMLGSVNYLYTYITDNRFTNMSATLLILSVIIFLMGLLAEQITVLIYAINDKSMSRK
jgi:glycosyltransferase involved in cell wall biosynthesis